MKIEGYSEVRITSGEFDPDAAERARQLARSVYFHRYRHISAGMEYVREADGTITTRWFERRDA